MGSPMGPGRSLAGRAVQERVDRGVLLSHPPDLGRLPIPDVELGVLQLGAESIPRWLSRSPRPPLASSYVLSYCAAVSPQFDASFPFLRIDVMQYAAIYLESLCSMPCYLDTSRNLSRPVEA
jgi:hypothetical protein